jgi:hypothetical protein
MLYIRTEHWLLLNWLGQHRKKLYATRICTAIIIAPQYDILFTLLYISTIYVDCKLCQIIYTSITSLSWYYHWTPQNVIAFDCYHSRYNCIFIFGWHYFHSSSMQQQTETKTALRYKSNQILNVFPFPWLELIVAKRIRVHCVEGFQLLWQEVQLPSSSLITSMLIFVTLYTALTPQR